jgi:hypothetical protein
MFSYLVGRDTAMENLPNFHIRFLAFLHGRAPQRAVASVKHYAYGISDSFPATVSSP